MKTFLLICLASLSAAELNAAYFYQQATEQQPFIPYVSALHLQNNGATSGNALQYLPLPAPPPSQQTEPPHPTSLQSELSNKEFYSFAAPEEEFEDSQGLHKIESAVQKNVRVIFIKAPENRALEHAAIKLAKLNAEDQTAIYVLSKQADIGDLANRLSTLRAQGNHKPAVHFVKYRTAEEAAHAQHTIKAHYDNKLPGQTLSLHEDIAPVLNFATQSAGNAVGHESSLGNYLGQNVPHATYGTPPQLATAIAPLEYGNFYGQATDFGAFKNPNFAIPQAIGALSVGAGISSPIFNAGFGGSLEQSVDLSAYKANYGAFKSSNEAEHPKAEESSFARTNARVSSGGGSSIVFPTEAPSRKTYLPPSRNTYLPPLPQLKSQRI